ncbi:MAG: DUF1800 family protein, partial [Gammaproteobacteria bacterium]
ERFYKSNYEIGQLMDDIFTSDWFYDEKNIGTRIKSPIELLVGMRRMLPMELANEESQLLLQRLLGQVLFVPPNVAGWPGGKAWIDSTTLMYRLRLPLLIDDRDDFNIKPKDDDDLMMGKMDAKTISKRQPAKSKNRLQVDVDWNAYTQNFTSVAREKLVEVISGSLLQVKPAFTNEVITSYADSSSKESFIRFHGAEVFKSIGNREVCSTRQ